MAGLGTWIILRAELGPRPGMNLNLKTAVKLVQRTLVADLHRLQPMVRAHMRLQLLHVQ